MNVFINSDILSNPNIGSSKQDIGDGTGFPDPQRFLNRKVA
jgi:hypothetical protein